MTKLEQLGKELANVLLTETHEGPLAEINAELTRIAMVESGVRMEELSDDNMEDSPIVRLYYSELSTAWAKVLNEAARLQHFQKSLEA